MATETTEMLASAGRALYGDDKWQAPFARALGVSQRTLQRWLAGQGEPHPDVLRRAHGLLTERRALIDAAARDIDGFLTR